MNAELRRSDEAREVVAAAELWRQAGAIDEATLAAIRSRFPDDRRRARPGFRVLFFVFTLLAVQAAFVFCLALTGGSLLGTSGQTLGLWQLLFALACGFGAERAISSLKMRGFGIDEALVAMAIGFGTGATGLLLESGLEPEPRARLLFAVLGALAAFAAWRWGTGWTGLAAGVGLFGALFWTPFPRAAWLAAGSLLAVVADRAARHSAVAPAHRGRWRELFVVAVLALYAAVHVWSVERPWYDGLAGFLEAVLGLSPAIRAASWAAMVLLPLACLVLGLREREEIPLALGALLAIATGASAMAELDRGPGWARLLVGGAVLLGLAVHLRRQFSRHPGRAWHGFTDLALFDARRAAGLLEVAAAIAVFTPAPPASKPEGFRGEGGDFGGGGASGKF